jgi:hypothetical protein
LRVLTVNKPGTTRRQFDIMSTELPDGDGTEDETPHGGDAPPNREEVLALLNDGMREAHEKVTSGRVYDAENEKVRQKWIRTLAYVAGQYRQLKKDEELEDMASELEELREELEEEGFV